jgi:hypothetical protein
MPENFPESVLMSPGVSLPKNPPRNVTRSGPMSLGVSFSLRLGENSPLNSPLSLGKSLPRSPALSLGLSSPLNPALSLPLSLGEYRPSAGVDFGSNGLTAC